MALPYEIRNQIIQCIGLCFHYKDNVEAFFISCDIDKKLVQKYKADKKFVWARKLLNDLDETGFDKQKKILTELCKFKKLPDQDAPNPDAGLSALRKLKVLALEHKFEITEKKKSYAQNRAIQEEKQKIIQERANKLLDLKNSFYNSMINPNRQSAGYLLEDILEELFPLFDIEYRKSFKNLKSTQQIDGHFKFEGFDYLVEAKWRSDQPNENEIGGFERKVNTKLESTRGLFISINGVRKEVMDQFNGKGSNIIFFDGSDLTHILEGRIDLREALRIKIDTAAQEGLTYYPVSLMLKNT